jgi:hypothetical protein
MAERKAQQTAVFGTVGLVRISKQTAVFGTVGLVRISKKNLKACQSCDDRRME